MRADRLKMYCREIGLFLDVMAAERGASPNTIDAYCRDLEQFFKYFNIQAKSISSSHISNYTQWLGEKYYSPKTQTRKLSAIKEFCKFLFSEKIITQNPALNISAPKPEKPLPSFLTPEQISLLVKQAQCRNSYALKRIGVMIAVMFATGLRVSELVSLPQNAINHDRHIISVRGKGSKERIVPINHYVSQTIFAYEKYRNRFIAKGKSSKFLFPSKFSASGHITRFEFYKQLKTLALECGIYTPISPHTLRHSFATNLLNHHADLRSVQKMLGHENIATTEIYTHITSENLVKEVLNKHPLQNFKL